MDIFFYTILFIIGIVIGSYWDEKAKKIPKKLDMRKTHYSNYKHEDLISKLTYIILGGVTSVVLANILGLDIHELDIAKMIIYIFSMIYISTLVLIAGIDRVYTKIDKKLLGFGIVSSLIYMIYLCGIDFASVYISAIYIAIYIVLLILDTFLLRRYAKDSYIINNLMLLSIIIAFTDLRTLTYTITMSTIAITLYALIQQIQKKKYGNKKLKINEIPVGYFIAASNIIVLFVIRIFENYLI